MASKSSTKGEDLTNLGRFERKITEEVNKREAPTFIEGKLFSSNLEDRSYFDTYLLDFGRLDNEEPLIIAGNDAQIALQASLLRAVDQLLTVRGLGAFNFPEWARQFELGFDKFQSPELKKMRDGKKKEVWPGIERENRPKILELKPLDNNKKLLDIDFKLVQFFPNRHHKDEWKLFTGSYREIAQQILNWWNQKEGEGEAGSLRLTSDISQLSKHPYISLHFKEEPKSGRIGTPLKTDISFRLMDQQEWEGLLPGNSSIISITDIKRYAKSVERIFNSNPDKPYSFQRGRGSYMYNNWPLGYKLWLLANSATEAERVFKDVLGIQNHKFDELYMTIAASRNPAKAYPITPPKKKILNEEKALPNRRQTGKVVFRWAKLVLPMSKDTLVLSSREPRMRVDEKLK